MKAASRKLIALATLTAFPTLGTAQNREVPDREMLRMMEFLREMEMIKQVEMIREMPQIESIEREAKNAKSTEPAKPMPNKKETLK